MHGETLKLCKSCLRYLQTLHNINR